MLIYTGTASTKAKLSEMKKRGMGIMISNHGFSRSVLEVPCAIDNGAWQMWMKGYPFIESFFWKIIEKCFILGVKPDFIVCPDLVAQGIKSLDFSRKWAEERLTGAPRLALAVQDGLEPKHITYELEFFSHIFVGGTVEWKWRTAENWVKFAHSEGKKCHIGRCGTEKALSRAMEIGADSVDSSSFVRNDSWDIVDRFNNKQQQELLCTG